MFWFRHPVALLEHISHLMPVYSWVWTSTWGLNNTKNPFSFLLDMTMRSSGSHTSERSPSSFSYDKHHLWAITKLNSLCRSSEKKGDHFFLSGQNRVPLKYSSEEEGVLTWFIHNYNNYKYPKKKHHLSFTSAAFPDSYINDRSIYLFTYFIIGENFTYQQ